MRVLYVAEHGKKESNDDEGAITHALRVLGHAVYVAKETERPPSAFSPFDMMLCHYLDEKSPWWDWARGKMPTAVWYFDQVISPSPINANRNKKRKEWIERVQGIAHKVFLTDGDYRRSRPDTTYLLRQGADERWFACPPEPVKDLGGKVLMTASIGKDGKRKRQVDSLKKVLGDRLVLFKKGLYGDAFRSAVATADVCVAPEFPSTDLYWSNRVYVTLAAGGFLLHPGCMRLFEHEYQPGAHLESYHDDFTLIERLNYWLNPAQAERRAEVKRLAKQETFDRHLYRHRLLDLLTEMKK